MSSKLLCPISALLAVLLLGAQAPPPPAKPSPNTDSLRAAELAFAASVRDKDRERFAAAVADDAIFVNGKEALRGKAAIVAAWESLFAAEAPPMEWHPEVAEVQDGGDLGMTRGPWTINAKDKAGNPAPVSGIFNSVWRHQKDGGWKVIFDMGCPPCPCAGKK